MSQVPVIDLAPWFSGDDTARAAVGADVDDALRSVGFFLISGHGVPDELVARVRAQARAFFALPPTSSSATPSASAGAAGCRPAWKGTPTPRALRLRRT